LLAEKVKKGGLRLKRVESGQLILLEESRMWSLHMQAKHGINKRVSKVRIGVGRGLAKLEKIRMCVTWPVSIGDLQHRQSFDR
jgi:hypothetical protein